MLRRRSAASSPISASAWSTVRPRRSPTTFSRILPRMSRQVAPRSPRFERFPAAESLDPARDGGSELFPFQGAFGPKSATFQTRAAAAPGGRSEKRAFGPEFGRKVMPAVSMTVNGKAVTGDVEARTLLVQFLRENLRLTGTHVGCDTSQCGACVVHVDGSAIKSCTTLALSCEGAHVTTIEGLAQGGKLHPMQQAFQDNHGLQCGFCTPGMIMASIDIVYRKGHELSEHTIREE